MQRNTVGSGRPMQGNPESGIQHFFAFGIRNPGLWNPESSPWNPESNLWNPESNLIHNSGILV